MPVLVADTSRLVVPTRLYIVRAAPSLTPDPGDRPALSRTKAGHRSVIGLFANGWGVGDLPGGIGIHQK